LALWAPAQCSTCPHSTTIRCSAMWKKFTKSAVVDARSKLASGEEVIELERRALLCLIVEGGMPQFARRVGVQLQGSSKAQCFLASVVSVGWSKGSNHFSMLGNGELVSSSSRSTPVATQSDLSVVSKDPTPWGLPILWLQQTAMQRCSLQHSGRINPVVQPLSHCPRCL